MRARAPISAGQGRAGRGTRFVLFTRWPEAGATKTRLIPALGPEGAADLQRRLTEHMLGVLRRTAAPTDIEVRYVGGSEQLVRDWLGHDLIVRAQPAGALGLKMAAAIRRAFVEGATRVLVVGSDIPGITPAILRRAQAALAQARLVFGPAVDGGYYLVGQSRYTPAVFDGIDWGTSRVLAQTRRTARRHGARLHLLPPLADVDRPADLPVWEEECGR